MVEDSIKMKRGLDARGNPGPDVGGQRVARVHIGRHLGPAVAGERDVLQDLAGLVIHRESVGDGAQQPPIREIGHGDEPALVGANVWICVGEAGEVRQLAAIAQVVPHQTAGSLRRVGDELAGRVQRGVGDALEAGRLRRVLGRVVLQQFQVRAVLIDMADAQRAIGEKLGAGALPDFLADEVLAEIVVTGLVPVDAAEGPARVPGRQLLRVRRGPHGDVVVAVEAPERAVRRERAADERAVASVLASLRARIAELYATPDAGARSATRSQLESDARATLRALPLASRAAGELATRIQLQDACLARAGTYERDLPVWARRLDAMGGDLPAFVSAARAEIGRAHV
jgi:hypothetical protein